MEVFRIILQVVFIILCIALTVLVLMQEGKSAGFGSHKRCGGNLLG